MNIKMLDKIEYENFAKYLSVNYSEKIHNIANNEIEKYDKKHSKDKANHHIAHENRLRDSGVIDVLFHGRTANPDKEEAEKHNLLYKREERRDKHGNDRQPYHEHHGKQQKTL